MTYLLKLFLIFFKIGAFTFGGGLAMVPLIKQEVINNNFMSLDDFIDFIAISESTPGPLAVNMSTYVGYITKGIPGALICTLGVILPSFIIILIVSKFYDKFKDNLYIKNMMNILKPVIIGLIISTFISLFISVFFNNSFTLSIFTNKEFYITLLIFIFGIIFSKYQKSTILLIVLSGCIGITLGMIGLI